MPRHPVRRRRWTYTSADAATITPVNAGAPCRALRAVLEDARRAQLDFGDVWPSAVAGAVATVDDPGERAQWSAVLEDTRGSWATAYAGDPAPPVELALVLIAQDPERCEPVAVAAGGGCAHCGGPIGEHKRRNARYCSGRCRRDASVARLAA